MSEHPKLKLRAFASGPSIQGARSEHSGPPAAWLNALVTIPANDFHYLTTTNQSTVRSDQADPRRSVTFSTMISAT